VTDNQHSTTVTMAAAGFLLMASHSIARPVANAFFLEFFDSGDMLWGMAAVPLLVTLLLWPYGLSVSRFGPRWTLLLSTALSGLFLAAPMLLYSPASAFFLYVWKDVFVVFLVEQFWARANSTYSVEAGKKVYGVLLFIGGFGAVGGGEAVSLLSPTLGTWTVYAGSFLLLIPFAGIMLAAFARGSAGDGAAGAVRPGGAPAVQSRRGGHTGLSVLARSPYLIAIAAVVGLGQVMAASLDVVFHSHVEQDVLGLDDRASFEAHFWSLTNAASMVLQAATPLVFRVLSVRVAHLVIPLTHAAAGLVLLVHPALWTAGLAFAWFKVVDYSLFRASKEVLYVPLDFDSRYRAKMLIDVGIYRLTKGGAALVLSLGERLAAAAGGFLPLAALAAAGAWGLFALKIGRDFAKIESEGETRPRS
jgi:AAA family ATP:ADP antiporter